MFFKKIGFLGILGRPSYGIGATIRIGREMLCLPYAGFFHRIIKPRKKQDPPPIGKIHPFRKMAVTFKLHMGL